MVRIFTRLFVFLILIVCYATTTVSGSSKQRPKKVPSSSGRKLNNVDSGSKKDEGGVDKDGKNSSTSSGKGQRWAFFKKSDDKNNSDEKDKEVDKDSEDEEDSESQKGFQFFRRNKKEEKKDQSNKSNSEEKESKSDSATKSKNDDDDGASKESEKKINRKKSKKKKEEKTATDDVKKNKKSDDVKEEETTSSKNNDAGNTTVTGDEQMNSNTTSSTIKEDEEDEENCNNSNSTKTSNNNHTLTLRDLILMPSPRRTSPFNSPPYFNQRFPQQQHHHTMPDTSPENNNWANNGVLAQIIPSIIKYGILFILMKSSDAKMMQPTRHFVWERLNDRYILDETALKGAIDLPPHGVSSFWWKKQISKKQGKKPKMLKQDSNQAFSRTVVVIDADNISQKHLANIVNFIIGQHRNHAFGTEKGTSQPLPLEILFKIDSPGGPVGSFGLAASQVSRLRSIDGITTTVCVDVCAASGGYMIASQANKLVAAPFATVGSIGVIMEGLNFHDILRQYGIRPFTLKAGENKNPITQYGQISKDAIDSVNEDLDRIHDAFKAVVIKGRPQLLQLDQKDSNGNKKTKATKNTMDGSVFLGEEAKELHLVDEVMTSEEYIMDRICDGDRVLQLHKATGLSENMGLMNLLPLFFRTQTKKISTIFTQTIPSLSSKNNYLNSILSDNKKIVKIGSVIGFIQYISSKYTITERD